eukprot:895300-Pleurochrysis_carterae.AAC.1
MFKNEALVAAEPEMVAQLDDERTPVARPVRLGLRLLGAAHLARQPQSVEQRHLELGLLAKRGAVADDLERVRLVRR